MPAIVDHEARRAILARIAADLIAAEGIEAATVRAIATAAGFSTKVVSHYFTDKRALMMATYRFAADHSAAMAAAAQPTGGADARAYLVSLLPIDPAMVRDWKVWLAFWAFAISDAEFAAEQRRQVLRARAQVADLLARDARFAALSVAARSRAARDLITLVIGVALQAAFDAKDWTPGRQVASVTGALARLS